MRLITPTILPFSDMADISYSLTTSLSYPLLTLCWWWWWCCAGAGEEAEDGDGGQGAVQGVWRGGEAADLAGQPSAVRGRGVTAAQAVHRGEGGGAVQQRALGPPQLLQPLAQSPAPGRGGNQRVRRHNETSQMHSRIRRHFIHPRQGVHVSQLKVQDSSR